MPVVNDALPPGFPLGVEFEVFLRREGAERHKLWARRHDSLRQRPQPGRLRSDEGQSANRRKHAVACAAPG